MFKPLLRTLPSLSGNISLSCHVEPVYKGDDVIYTYVKNASLEPLDSLSNKNKLTSKHLNISLINDRWEYNVKDYYKYYKNTFYNANNYNVKPVSFENFNPKNNNINYNIDYVFGCKRINYKEYGYQFMFYAPFFINDVEHLPDYFEINVKYNNTKSKKIRIYINKDNDNNYLGYYLKKYVNKINSNVIFIQNSNSKAIYYGIDINKGGLVKYQYDDFNKIYKNQTTINTVDSIINLGFQTKNIIMQQIIPLAFMFNLDDIFSEQEKTFFRYHSFTISGAYYKDNIKIPFYDFDYNYENYYPTYLKYVERLGNYLSVNDVNVMDIDFPGLHEKQYINYTYSNKLLKTYNHWVMTESNNQYITNINYSYSSLINGYIKYSQFPSILKDLLPHLKIIHNDIKLPINENINSYYADYKVINNEFIKVSNDYENYKTLMQNYVSNWFTLYNDYIFNDDNVWADVNNDNYYSSVYYKGILYQLYDKNNIDFKIDKFGVFINPILDILNTDDKIYNGSFVYSLDNIYNNGYYTSSIALNDNYQNMSYYSPGVNYSIGYYINNDVKLKEDKYNGTYIKKINYYEQNRYYKVSNLINLLTSINNNALIDDIVNHAITLYERLPLNNNINMLQYDKDSDTYKIIFYDELFDGKNDNAASHSLKESLYISIYPDRSKKQVAKMSYYNFKYNELEEGKYTLFLKTLFISQKEIDIILSDPYYNSIKSNILNKLPHAIKYNYIPYKYDNGIYIEDYIEKQDKQLDDTDGTNSIIYVDSFNLNNYLNYNFRLYNTYKMFCRFINKDHIIEYLQKLYKNSFDPNSINNETVPSTVILKSNVYYKNRCVTKRYNNKLDVIDLEFKDEYIPISKLLDDLHLSDISASEFLDLIETDVRDTNDKFCLHINNIYIYLDLCFKGSFYQLDKNIFDRITKDDNGELLENPKSVYLYINDNCVEEYRSTLVTYDQTFGVLSTQHPTYTYNNFIECLKPLFNSVYFNDYTYEEFKNLINSEYIIKMDNNIYKFNNTGDICYYELQNKKQYVYDKYNDLDDHIKNDIQNAYDINSENYMDDNKYNDLINVICEQYNMSFYSVYNVNNINMHKYDNNTNIQYNENLNIYSFDKEGKKYGYVLIDVYLNNTNMSFSIYNDNKYNYVFNTINNEPSNNKETLNDTINKYFNILYPFLKVNIFDEALNNILNKIIVLPESHSLSVNYIFNEDTHTIDTLANNNSKIKLIRYFGNIMPAFSKQSNSIINNHIKLFKDPSINNTYEDPTYIRSSVEDMNYYKGVYVLTDSVNNTYEFKKDVEYKHFNDNKIYFIENKIIIDYDSYMIESQVTDEFMYEQFKKYIIKCTNYTLLDDEILFLYNKYDHIKKLNTIDIKDRQNKQLYKIQLQFILK